MAKYTDLNSAFNNTPADLNSTLTDINAIKKNLERLFLTTKGEVPFNRAYGSSLHNLLFETNLDASDIRMFLYMDITEFEPRVSLNPADIEITQKILNTYVVSCTFSVPSLNNTVATVQSSVSKN